MFCALGCLSLLACSSDSSGGAASGAHAGTGAGAGTSGEGDAAFTQATRDAAALADSAAQLGSKDAAANDAAQATDASVNLDAGADEGRSCKRGLAYNHEFAADAPAFGDSIGWWYNWGSAPEPDANTALRAADVEYVPMVWTGPPRRDLDVQALIDAIPEGAKYLLGFNEPNFGAQASLTPEQAAAAWPALEQVAKARNLKLVSPAVNYCGGDCNQTDPFAWLDAFFAACTDCQVDYVAFHWYACSLDALQWVVGEYESKYGKPVWLTEFACLDDPGDHSAAGQLAYMNEAVPFLENDPMVFRYAWFIGRSSQPGAIDLFAGPGALTTLGAAYAGYAGFCD